MQKYVVHCLKYAADYDELNERTLDVKEWVKMTVSYRVAFASLKVSSRNPTYLHIWPNMLYGPIKQEFHIVYICVYLLKINESNWIIGRLY